MLKPKVLNLIPLAAIGIFMMMGFQNCGAAKFTDTGADVSFKSSDAGVVDHGDLVLPPDISTNPPAAPTDNGFDIGNNDDPWTLPTPIKVGPGQTPVAVDNPAEVISDPNIDDNEPVKKNCADFKGLKLPLAIPASAPVLRSSGENGFMDYDVLAKSITVTGHAGSFIIRGAGSAELSGNSGRVLAAANSMRNISGGSGNSCYVALEFGSLSGLAGGAVVVANTIGSISGTSGPIHVYHAKIKSVLGNTKICLHDGAVVLNSSGNDSISNNCH